MAARTSRCGPALRTQRSDHSAVAQALASRGRRGAGAVLSAAPGAAGLARGRRAHPPGSPGVRLRGGAHPALAPAGARDPVSHGHDSASVSRHGPAPPADPQAGTPPDETLREGGTGGVDSGRREVREDRGRVLRLYRRLPPRSSRAFLAELRRAFPFPIQRLQCDHGQEFSFAFVLGVEAAGIRHHYIRPRRPQQNGKVERSHRIDQEEFWGRQRFPDFEAAAAALRGWETRYNYERFSLALQGRTPAEKLAGLQPPLRAA